MKMNHTPQELASVLKNNGIAVVPTDTLYGILARFSSQVACEKIYKVKGRDADKRLIALVDSFEMAQQLSAAPLPSFLKEYWPGPLTVITTTAQSHPYKWDTQAIRFPKNDFLLETIKILGEPIFAPSANPQGSPPCRNAEEAQQYFGSNVDFYIEGGIIEGGQGSTIISIVNEELALLREGAVTLPDALFNSRKA